MSKNVQFSDKVNVRYIKMSLADHALEVKNPIAIIFNEPTHTGLQKQSIFHSLFWGFSIIIFIIIWWLIWKCYRKKSVILKSEKS
jgi:hypothetical protein